MNFLSICSGIDAASVAFNPLGWKAVGFSEIEPFPCAVLAHHYPDVPNFGDMTKFKEWPEDILAKVDIVVGGPPCQAFSVAGMRGGLDDARGNLTLTYVELIDHVDAIRYVRGLPPVLALYENVPGLLSDKTNAFGCLVGAIAGQSEAIETETGKWPTCGIFWGEKRRVGYRILDAQFFGLAQRRRRVFLLAVPNELVERVGERADPGEILSIPTSLRRDSAPSREARQEVAAGVADCLTKCRAGSPDEARGTSTLIPSITQCLTTRTGRRYDPETETILPFDTTQITSVANRSSPKVGDPCHPLAALAHVPAIAFSRNDDGRDATTELSPTIRVAGNADGMMAVALPINTMIALRHEALGERTGFGIGSETDPAFTVTKGHSHAVAYALQHAQIGRKDSAGPQGKGWQEEVAFTQDGGGRPLPAISLPTMQVRRLTPVECARLQGFPDDYLDITYRKKPAADGPKYKALGNSWATPVVSWIGRRIKQHLEDRIAAADAIECDRAILAARTLPQPNHGAQAAMNLALEALQAFVEHDRGDHEDSVGMMISYAVALSMAKDAIAALEKEVL